MSKAEEFQRHAEKCQELAEREANPDFRSSWLGIARSWLFLLEQERRWSTEEMRRFAKQPHTQFH